MSVLEQFDFIFNEKISKINIHFYDIYYRKDYTGIYWKFSTMDSSSGLYFNQSLIATPADISKMPGSNFEEKIEPFIKSILRL